MNMGSITGYADFYGRGDPASWNAALRDFFALAADMKSRLGDQGYLLGGHLQMLLSVVAAIPLAQVSLEGFGSGKELAGAIRRIMRGEPGGDNPMYEKAKAYIEEHPLPWQESYTRHSLYFAALFGDYAEVAAEEYQWGLAEHMRTHAHLDTVKLEQRRSEICGLLNDSEDMVRLEGLFRRCFLFVVPMTGFMQGMADELLSVLMSRDEETSKLIFQLLLESNLAYEE